MPLDKDQYNIRRTYLAGRAILAEPQTQRNEIGNVIGETYNELGTLAYNIGTLTQTDRIWLGDAVTRVSKKIEVPYNPLIKERTKTINILIDNEAYNIAQIDINMGRNMFLYLEKVTKKGSVHNA